MDIDEAERAITWASQYKMYMLPWKCEAPKQGFEKCNFGHLSGLANCSSELRVTFLGDPHHKIYVVVVRRQVFKTATLAGGLDEAIIFVVADLADHHEMLPAMTFILFWCYRRRFKFGSAALSFKRCRETKGLQLHYCSRNIWATYGLHMGHIWGPGLQHMELFQHMGKKILQKAQHMGNIWVSLSNIWGSFETYRSFLKHMGPFWNIWGLSWKVFVSFSDLPHCIIPVYEFFFFSQKLRLSQIRPVPDISAKENRLLEVSGRAWNLFSTIKGGKPPAKNFKLILRLRFCQLVCIIRRRRRAPTVAWTLSGSLSSAAAAWRARACGSSKCPPPAKIEPGLLAGEPTVSGEALRVQRKIWAAADFQNFLTRPNTRRPRKKGG